MNIHIDDAKKDLSTSQLQAADDFLARVSVGEIVFDGAQFTPLMIEVARMALRHKVVMQARTPETLRGVDELVTGGLQNIH